MSEAPRKVSRKYTPISRELSSGIINMKIKELDKQKRKISQNLSAEVSQIVSIAANTKIPYQISTFNSPKPSQIPSFRSHNIPNPNSLKSTKPRTISNTYISNFSQKKSIKSSISLQRSSNNIQKSVPINQKSIPRRSSFNKDLYPPSLNFNSQNLNPQNLVCKKPDFNELEKHKLRALIRRFHDSIEEVTRSESDLKSLIESNGGLPLDDSEAEQKRIRSLIWKFLLRIKTIKPDEYLIALKNCPSKSFSKIKDDVFRTLATDSKFKKAVPDKVLIRILNAIVCCGETDPSFPPRYVQGMNALLAPFSFVLNEPSAFYAFKQFLLVHCPSYVRPFLPGVIAGSHLVDECLAVLDPELFVHLHANGANGVIYAYSSVMTLSAGVPPLNELLRLWDYFLAFGAHLNIVCIVAQVQAIRDLLLTSSRPNEILRVFPPLNAASIIRRARKIYKELPKRVVELLRRHTIDVELAISISNKDPDLNLTSSFLISNVCKSDVLGYRSLGLNESELSLNRQISPPQKTSDGYEGLAEAKPKRRKMPTNLGLGVVASGNNTVRGALNSVRNFNPSQHSRVRKDLQNWISLEKD
ncbi:putative mitotic check point protein BUB2 [Smittium mucronatum]|uniref:Putative mitotic check point protein BUB2 n=1 Tax=Smittium mucronatum TaxID=133383 RepID=A0A1R0H953_9FUNG|nr:putative mitotic check point protein BUB2 [Smittium mucronatum]